MAECSHRWLLSAILKQCLSTGLVQRSNLAQGAAARVARGGWRTRRVFVHHVLVVCSSTISAGLLIYVMNYEFAIK